MQTINNNDLENVLYINADLANLQFPMACMHNAISEYDFSRIELDHRSGARERTIIMHYAILLIYQFAFFESHIEYPTWKVYSDNADVKRLIAYRHIRHAFAHSL